ncbi:hypothetical protein CALVIDRAFT_563526 [Calocera viscosa TUFC12733]|uniref:Uncharacterized protein n=1 Tax=Calocera viscosa (strain TUFC12733) TaxID=1330018 RepID=A0A167MN33_CALVF|nr:hypothetical protein CALVIDRAFT_563526 [Calocera viscosa TUFC12733]
MASMRRPETNAMKLERHLEQLLKRQDILKSSLSEKQNRAQEMESALKALLESRRKLNEELEDATENLSKVDAEIENIEDALKAAHVVDAELARIDGARVTELGQGRPNGRGNDLPPGRISDRTRGRQRISDTGFTNGNVPVRDNTRDNPRAVHSDPVWTYEVDDESENDPLDAFRVSPSPPPPPRKKPKTEPREVRHSVYRPL